MGATLEFSRIEAKDFSEAVTKLRVDFYTSDPYSGDFNTCYDFYDCSKRFEDVNAFDDWVEREGEKREAYFYEYEKNHWLVGGWCAC